MCITNTYQHKGPIMSPYTMIRVPLAIGRINHKITFVCGIPSMSCSPEGGTVPVDGSFSKYTGHVLWVSTRSTQHSRGSLFPPSHPDSHPIHILQHMYFLKTTRSSTVAYYQPLPKLVLTPTWAPKIIVCSAWILLKDRQDVKQQKKSHGHRRPSFPLQPLLTLINQLDNDTISW